MFLPKTQNPKPKNGFTLLEVIVAVFIVALMSTIVIQILMNSFDLKEVISKKDRAYHEARLVISKLTNELSQSYIRPKSTEVQSTTESAEVVFLGEDTGELDSLTFNSFSHFRYLADKRESDQNKLMYFTKENEEGIRVLYRKEMTHFNTGSEDEGVSYQILTGVSRFDLQYCDGTKGEWRNAWNSESIEYTAGLPMAVSLKLEMIPDKINEEDRLEFRALIPIESELQRITGSGEVHKACEEVE